MSKNKGLDRNYTTIVPYGLATGVADPGRQSVVNAPETVALAVPTSQAMYRMARQPARCIRTSLRLRSRPLRTRETMARMVPMSQGMLREALAILAAITIKRER